MATWTVALDKPVVRESPNAVAYVTYSSNDDRSVKNVRVPYWNEAILLSYLATECKRLSALDDRDAEMDAVVAGATVAPGPLTLPDISKQDAVQAAQAALRDKVTAALVQAGTNFTKEQIAAARAIDPTVADAVAALEAAQTG